MSRRPWIHALLLALLASGPLATASAQNLWRCGADGRTFSDRPCADGAPLVIGRRPQPEAVAEARAVAAREREALRQLAHERRERHADAARAGLGPAGIRPAPPTTEDSVSARPRTQRRYVVRVPD